jgi:hypothetical protein
LLALLLYKQITGFIIGPDADYRGDIFVVFLTLYRHMLRYKRLKASYAAFRHDGR